MTRPLDLLRDRLEAAGCRPRGPEHRFESRCPSHEDRDPSLSAREGNDGRALVHCHAGCRVEDILDRLDLSLGDLFEKDMSPRALRPVRVEVPEAPRLAPPLGPNEKEHVYTDEQGQPLIRSIRTPTPEGGKRFRQDSRSDGNWVQGLNGVRRVPYRLPELVAAVAADEMVAIAEGEKCVEVLAWLGIPATCNPMGAGKPLDDYAQFFRGARVAIFPDCDEPGRAHAEAWVKALTEAAEVRLVELAPERSDGWDIADLLFDWHQGGASREDLKKLVVGMVDQAPVREVEVPTQTEVPGATSALLDGLTLADVLEAATALIDTYMVMSPEALDTCALWVAHTHVVEAFDTTPYLEVTSPERRCGKSLLIELLELLVDSPWKAINPSEATLYRRIGAEPKPTLLLDETDGIFGKAKEATEGIRSVLNAGFRQGGTVPRCIPPSHVVEFFEVFCAKAFAGIGNLPDTISDRSIPINLQRRTREEGQGKPRFRIRKGKKAAQPIHDAFEAWAATAEVEDLLAEAEELLDQRLGSLHDRAADIWEALLVVAIAAGGDWVDRAVRAALALTEADDPTETLGTSLLRDVHAAFQAEPSWVTFVKTADILTFLYKIEESPWADFQNGRALSAHRLARELRRYVGKTTSSRDHSHAKGYTREVITEAAERYLGL